MREIRRTFGARLNRRHMSATAMLCGVSAVALSAMAIPAFAQDTAPATDEVEEIVVTGIRRSLQNAQTIKQTADVIVDSVTAEDIGALPDRSVTEALQRIPGVSINRFAAGVDPDHFSIEGSGVTVRGLNMTRSEVNGRDSFSANNGRSLSFADVPAELMGGVDVYKNPSANMIEGGIAGTVNLRTRLPFDSKGQVISFSGEYNYSDFVKKSSPTFSALYSNRWDTEIGEFGFLIHGVDSKLTSRSDGIQISNYMCRDNVQTYPSSGGTATPVISPNVECASGNPGVWFPNGVSMRTQTVDRERQGLAIAGQWRSTDDTMLATFQYLRSEATQAWTEHAIEITTDNVTSSGNSFPVYGTDVTYDENGLFTSGVISGLQGWRSDSGNTPETDRRTPVWGLQSNNIRRDQEQTYMTEDASFKFHWTPNEHWGFTFDLQHVRSNVDVIDNTLWASSFQDADITINGDDLPTYVFRSPTTRNAMGQTCPDEIDCPNGQQNAIQPYASGDHASYADPYNSFWRAAMDHFEQSEGKLTSARADVEYLFEENNYVKSINFGVRWAERDQTTRFSAYNWGRLSEIWGGTGPVWLDDTLESGGTSAGHYEAFNFDNFMRGDTANPTGENGYLFYSGDMVNDYQGYLNFANTVANTWVPWKDADGNIINAAENPCADGVTYLTPNWMNAYERCDVVTGSPFRLNEINPVLEKNKAAYVMVQFAHELANGGRLSGNVGLRYTRTDRTTSGYNAYPRSSFPSEAGCLDQLEQANTNHTTLTGFCALPAQSRADLRAWGNGALSPIEASTSYRYLLPSFNLKYQPAPQWVFRLGLSKTLTPPDMGLVRAYYNIAGMSVNTDTQIMAGNTVIGNPHLKPTESNNIDLSAEWYFAPVGSVTLALFHKELTNVITNGTERIDFTNNGASFSLPVTRPINSTDKGKIKGFELAYQQVYSFLPSPFDGLGVNANYSYISSSGVRQSTLSATDPDVAAGLITTTDTSLLPLQGLSKHNANVAVFYEKYDISARLAYNWRDDFLITVRDVITPFNPIMQAASGQLDGSIFYNVTPKIKIGLQGVNLNNDVTQTLAVVGQNKEGGLVMAPRSWFMNDRRVTFVIRGTF